MTAPSRPPEDLPGDPALVAALELSEGRAFLALTAAVGNMPGNPFGAATARAGEGCISAIDAVPFGLFNRCVGLGASRPAREDEVDAVGAFFAARGTPESLIQMAPDAVTPEVTGWLQARGCVAGRNWVKLWHDLEDLEAPSPVGRLARVDAALADDFGRVVCEAFEMPAAMQPVATAAIDLPGTTFYVGYEDETAVAAGALFAADGIAWLGWGATLPDYRGRGWQTAMFRRRLLDARELGCRMAVTETGEETDDDPVNHSFRNMLRTGFRLAYARRNWVRRAPDA